MSAPAAPGPGGLLAALRALGSTLGEAAGLRGSLFAVELREEIERRKQMLVLAALAVALLHMAFVLLTLLVAVAFWETNRIGAVGTLAVLYLACGIAALFALRRKVAANPAAFAATRGELERDLTGLRAPR